jgi:hypothetical protein
VRVDGSIAYRSYKLIASGLRNVVLGSGITKVLSESKIDEIYLAVEPNHEILRLDVTMNIMASMKGFQST